MGRAFQAGVIDVGSHSVRLDIFDVPREGEAQLLESLNRPINLGFDVFRNGSVSSENIALLSNVMTDFAGKLAEYGIRERRVVATSAIREAFNRELVVSRVRHASELEIEVLESQEEARITYLAVRDELRRICDFDSLSGVAFVVGTGSLIVIYFAEGLMRFCEAVPLGTVRLYDEFGHSAVDAEEMVEILLASGIEQRVRDCARLCPGQPLTLIGIGAAVRQLVRRPDVRAGAVRMPIPEIAQLAAAAMKSDTAKLAAELHVPDQQTASLAPCGSLVTYFLKEFSCCEFICPATTTRTALLSELIRKATAGSDPFRPDILAAVDGIGHKYGFDVDHARNVAGNALKIYEKLKRYYDFPARGDLMLEIAALLHDVGRFVDARQHHKHSWYLVSNAQIPGLGADEQRIVAAVARYHRKSGPKSSHPEYVSLAAEEKVAVLKLAAILRVADALDRTHHRRFQHLKLRLRGEELLILAPEAAEARLEQLYLEVKSDLFHEVFGLKIRLGEMLEAR